MVQIWSVIFGVCREFLVLGLNDWYLYVGVQCLDCWGVGVLHVEKFSQLINGVSQECYDANDWKYSNGYLLNVGFTVIQGQLSSGFCWVFA